MVTLGSEKEKKCGRNVESEKEKREGRNEGANNGSGQQNEYRHARCSFRMSE